MLVDDKKTFFEEIEEHVVSQSEEGLFSSLQQGAWKRLQEVGLAHKKMSNFQYFPLSKLYATPFTQAKNSLVSIEEVEAYTLPECKGAVMVFVNGKYHQELSSLETLEGACSVLHFEYAMRSYGSFLERRIRQEIQRESSPFALMNSAFHTEAAFLYVPTKMQINQPVQVLQFVTSCAEAAYIHPKLHIVLGKESLARVIITHACSPNSTHIYNGVVDATLETGARLELEEEVLGAPKCWHFSSLRAELKERAHLTAVRVTNGSEGVHFDDNIQLTGEQAFCELVGLGILKGNFAQANVFVEHKAPNCESSQLFKNVLMGLNTDLKSEGAKSSFEGKIYVHSEAQKTNAFQLNNNLILDDVSTAYAKPNLEIFADDVKASHGATTAEVDNEALFYLRSKGIRMEEAKKLLIQAFCMEVIVKLKTPTLQENALEVLRRYAD